MTDYNKLTVVKLREELKRRGLSHAGLKAALVARLDENDAAQNAPDAPEESQAEGQEEESATVKGDAPGEPPDPGNGDDAAEGTQTAPEEKRDDAMPPAPDHNEQDTQMVDALDKPAVEDVAKPPDEAVAEGAQDSSEQKEEVEEAKEVAHASLPALEEPVDDGKKVSSPDKELQTVEMTDATQEPAPESYAPITTTETQEDLSAPSRKPTDFTLYSTQTSVAPEEIQEDSKKRKRRSRSPVLLTQDVAMKRLKGEDGSPRSQTPDGMVAAYHMQTSDGEQDQVNQPAADVSAIKQPQGDARFKELFTQAPNSSSVEAQPIKQTADREVDAAVHPPTSALYVRNLMRPLQAATLKDHLATLAEPENSDDADVIEDFFLDNIKSHCLVQFRDVAAASRVRQVLHNRIWPDERSRKALWVDYVPEEKLKAWMEVEQNAARSRPPKRFEVVYENEGDRIVAYLQEGDSGPRRINTIDSRNSGASVPNSARPAATVPSAPKGDPGRGFKALDELFRSTLAKPKLYFKPVAADIARRRLERLKGGRGGGGRGGDETRRYTFDDKTTLVDNGPEFRPGYRGGSAPRGGRGGGFPQRGPRGGDSWRGGR